MTEVLLLTVKSGLPTPLPTDNFYKFGTILGLVFCVAMIYVWVLQQNAIASRGLLCKRQLRSRCWRVNPRVERLFSESRWNFLIFVPLAGFGLLVSGVSARHWYTKHQVLQDELLRLDVEAARAKAKDLLK